MGGATSVLLGYYSDSGDEIAAILVTWIVGWFVIGGLIGWAIGKNKGRGAAGFWLGGVLGLIGWVIVAVMQPTVEAQVADMQRLDAIRAATGGGYAPPSARRSSPSGLSSSQTTAEWAADPYGRHRYRYFNGREWTDQVANAGVVSQDPPEFPTPDGGDGWAADPFGRRRQRYYRNGAWTQHVSDAAGTSMQDPPGFPSPDLIPPAPPPVM